MQNNEITRNTTQENILTEARFQAAHKQEAHGAYLHLNKKMIMKKTLQVGLLTMLSRFIAIAREGLQVAFLGVGTVMSDAFITAFRIPNFFRHMFAEGALSASFVPVFVKTMREQGEDVAYGLLSLTFLLFQSILCVMYGFILFKTNEVVGFIVPGFSADQTVYAVTFLRILFPYIFLVSSSAILGSVLNAVNRFSIPAFGPALWNMVYGVALVTCLVFKLDPIFLCYGVLVAGGAQLLMHIVVYSKCRLKFGVITPGSKKAFYEMLRKFLPYFFGVSIVEINLFVGASVASFLPKGSVSLLYYASRFMNLPLGIFAVSFANILLSHFSRVVLYAPRRMSFYLVEALKLVTWIIVPATVFFVVTSEHIFIALFSIKKGTPEQLYTASWLLIIYVTGLIFFCANKIMLSMFYSLKDTRSTTIIASIGALVNVVGDIIGMSYFGIYGIAAAAGLSGLVMTALCLAFLCKKHGLIFYAGNYLNFLIRYCFQLVCCVILFFMMHSLLYYAGIVKLFPMSITAGLEYWLTMLPLSFCMMMFMLFTKNLFGIHLYFIKHR